MRGKPSKRNVRGRTRWCVDWVEPLTGQRKRKIFDTRDAAQVKQDAVNKLGVPARNPLHPLVDPNVCLAAFGATWFWTQVETKAWTRSGTINAYREHVRRVCGFRVGAQPLGSVRVRDLEQGHVEAFVSGMRREGYAPRTTAMSYRVFHLLLDRAVSRRLLPAHPVTKDFYRNEIQKLLRIPKEQKGMVRAFEEAQAKAFLAVTVQHSRFHDLYVTGFLTGCRLGELCGLQLADDQVNLVEDRRIRQLHVQRHLTRVSTVQPVTGPTKSGSPRRVDVGTDLGVLLDRLKADRPKRALLYGWRPVPPWVFVSSVGHPLDQGLIRRDWDRMLTRAGLGNTGLTPHSMRHSFATWHINSGRQAKWVSQQLGHAKISITLNLYAHWFKSVDTDAANALGAALLGNTAGNTTTS